MISVIIPTLNRADSLKQVLESLAQQNATAEFEVLVIDNGSTDHTKAVVDSFLDKISHVQTRYIYEPEPGLLSGRHRGAKEAQGDILSYLDDDVELDLEWLRGVHAAFEDQTVQLVGGRNLPRYEVEPPPWLQHFWSYEDDISSCPQLSLLDMGNKRRIIDANYIWGLNFSIRKQALHDLGGFHPDCIPKNLQHFQGDGETGLTQKANQRGYKAIYEPLAVLYHVIPAARMTPEYFEARYFYQGVCDSYTAIRRRYRSGNVEHMPYYIYFRSYVGRIKARFKGLFKGSTEYKIIHQRCQSAYASGRTFHQQQVAHNPMLLEWVIRDNYWDYCLPDLAVSSFSD